MATIKQRDLVNAAAARLKQQRQNARNSIAGLVAMRDNPDYGSDLDAYILDQSNSLASGLQNVLDTMQTHQTEIRDAALAEGGTALRDDFIARFTELRGVQTAIQAADKAGIYAVLSGINLEADINL